MAENKRFRKTKYQGVDVYVSSKRRWRGKPEKCFYIRYRTSTGKMVRERVGWESEGVTAAFAAQVRGEKIRAVRMGSDPPTFRQQKRRHTPLAEFFYEVYLPWAKENKKSWRRDEELFRLWIQPELGELTLEEISPLHVEKVKTRAQGAGLSPRTVQYALAVVRQLFNRAKDWGYYEGENPVSKVKLPRPNNRRLRTLTPEEALRLLEACRRRSEDLYGTCLLSLCCGLRAGEIFSLRWEDVDFEGRALRVRDPKNRESRIVPAGERVMAYLREKRESQDPSPGDLVFPARGSNGKGVRREVSKAFVRTVEELGLNEGVIDSRNKVVFHTLRHSFASFLAAEGTSLSVIAELLGHRTLQMVRRYSHMLPSASRKAIHRVEKVLDPEEA